MRDADVRSTLATRLRSDWTVRDGVRAKLPGAIKLVIEQMEAVAPRYAA